MKHENEETDDLSPRECAVMEGAAQGETSKATAGRLNLSHRTVETFRDRAKRKLKAHSITEALTSYLQRRLGQPHESTRNHEPVSVKVRTWGKTKS